MSSSKVNSKLDGEMQVRVISEKLNLRLGKPNLISVRPITWSGLKCMNLVISNLCELASRGLNCLDSPENIGEFR